MSDTTGHTSPSRDLQSGAFLHPKPSRRGVRPQSDARDSLSARLDAESCQPSPIQSVTQAVMQ
jgi:hypothetical protein